MRIVSLFQVVPSTMAGALSEFEEEFNYPLGSACRFRISHGDDYLGFFRAMGEATLVVAEDGGEISGAIARVRKEKNFRDGNSVETLAAHYLCDLKVRADQRGRMVLPRLFRETKRQIEASDSQACYSVVMAGTGRLPTDYTGRLGIPKFDHLADITILRIAGGGGSGRTPECRVVDAAEFSAVGKSMKLPGYQSPTRASTGRSLSTPVHLVSGEGDACGIIEDTRRTKRLFLESGEELMSAHLTAFRYRDPSAAGALLHGAVELARMAGFPAIFTAAPSGGLEVLLPFLRGLDVTEAPATVFGIGMKPGMDWWVDTAEI